MCTGNKSSETILGSHACRFDKFKISPSLSEKNLPLLYTILSFGCSAWEGSRDKNGEDDSLKQKFKLRPISKTVFTIVLIGFAVHFSKTTAPGLLSNDPTNTELTFNNSSFNASSCENLCPNDDNGSFGSFFDTNQNQTEIEVYCNDLQYQISPNIHIGMWIAIGVLLALSWLEFALEACGDWMPYRQFLKPISKSNKTQNDPEAQAEELKPLAQTEGMASLDAEKESIAEKKARIEAEVKSLAEEQARLEAKGKAKAEKKARLEFEVKALAEEQARLEAKGKTEAEEKTRLEAKEKARLEAEAAEAKARLKAEEQARLEAEVNSLAGMKTRLEAEVEGLVKEKSRLEAEAKTKVKSEEKAS